MFLKKVEGPRAVTLPDGTVLSLADLPPAATQRWVASRKATVVRGVVYGLISKDEALQRYDLSEEEFQQRCSRVSNWVFEIVQQHGGSVSAEHGVGLLKKEYLGYSRSPVEIDIMRQIKSVFDPHGIMNPGKIFD